MPRFIYAKYKQDPLASSFVPMEDEGLFDIARELFANDAIREIATRVGVHGDLTEREEEEIDNVVIDGVERRQWKAPDPANLYIPIALVRQFSEGNIDPADDKAALEFIADRRCDGVVIGMTNTYKPNRLSELLPIMRALEKREDIKAPYKEVRKRNLAHAEKYFDDESLAKSYHGKASNFVFQQRFKYALLNRNVHGFSQIVALLGPYAEKKINHLDDEAAIDYVLSGNLSIDPQFHVLDDR